MLDEEEDLDGLGGRAGESALDSDTILMEFFTPLVDMDAFLLPSPMETLSSGDSGGETFTESCCPASESWSCKFGRFWVFGCFDLFRRVLRAP